MDDWKGSRCFRCGQPGHWADNCHLLSRAASEKEHTQRIQDFIDLWAEGKINTEQKRLAIGTENELWHGSNCPRHLKYPA